ncbi:hypothetical protein [Psychrobacillus sp. MER TA 171]|uniref:hypothetical protein n=1 Tax=Psychrobacillus sp. MER TA 171 TaxID=2939577 RepID=UPI00203F97F1|nr:hypothetical protein [Psychrobacillus sp. MER TA 171]MCM3359535.1 hypothetical protein [Psychrobacillus sp. MER TA 171]
MQFFEYRNIIAENLILFISLKGYTKTSFSKKVGISPLELNQIIQGDTTNPMNYEKLICKISASLSLPSDYFLSSYTENVEKWRFSTYHIDNVIKVDRSELVQTLLNDLEELLTVAAFYITEEKTQRSESDSIVFAPFYTIRQLACYFGVSITTINNWIKEGRFIGVERTEKNGQAQISANTLWRARTGKLYPISLIINDWETGQEKKEEINLILMK